MRLSRARAEAVAAVLVAAGVPADLIDVEAFGETEDMLPVPTPPGVSEPLNRCVGIFPEPAAVASQ
jgi:outer membrane protein OmpA-like peptidoglycan-associated protein